MDTIKEVITNVDVASGTKVVRLPKPKRAWRSRYVPHEGGGGRALFSAYQETMKKQRADYLKALNKKSAIPSANDISE